MHLELNLQEEMISQSELIKEVKLALVHKADAKIAYYRSKASLFASKYNKSFEDFQKEYESNPNEEFIKYDDLIVWEGYISALSRWQTKKEAFLNA